MRIHLEEIEAEVLFKDVKNIRLSVHPPDGRVRISAPRFMSSDAVRSFAASKLTWIRRHRTRLREMELEREPPLEYRDRESLLVWGVRCPLMVREEQAAPRINFEQQKLMLRIRPGTGTEARREMVNAWYREQLREAAAPIITRYERIMGVKVKRIAVRQMKTRWGSCTPRTGAIRLNTELARRPTECLEYLVVHEMVHLLESSHNARFAGLMDRFLPEWRSRRKLLKRQPIERR